MWKKSNGGGGGGGNGNNNIDRSWGLANEEYSKKHRIPFT